MVPRRLAPADRTTRRLLAIVAVGFVVRVVWTIFATRTPVGFHDPSYYVLYGDRLSRGLGYTTPTGRATAYYPIGYPAVLSLVFWIAHRLPGDHLLGAAIALNVAAGTATIAALGVTARRVAGDGAAIGTALVAALLPGLVFPTAAVLTETVFDLVLAVLLLVVCWRPWRQRWSRSRIIGAGALTGLACLIRPPALVLVPALIGLWLLAERRSLATVARRSLAFGGVALLVLLPWLARNWSTTGRPTLAASTGDNLCIGNNPDATGAFNISPYCFGDVAPEVYVTGTDARDATLTKRGLHWAKDNLAAEPALVFWRSWYTLDNDSEGVRAVQSYGEDPWLAATDADRLSTIADDTFFAFLFIALVGVIVLLRRVDRDERSVLFIVIAIGFLVAVWPFFGDERFHMPIVIALTVPSGVALAAIAGRLRRSRRG